MVNPHEDKGGAALLLCSVTLGEGAGSVGNRRIVPPSRRARKCASILPDQNDRPRNLDHFLRARLVFTRPMHTYL